MADSIYLGTDLKVLIEMEAPGFSMSEDNWEVSLKSGGKVLKTFAKDECIEDSEGKFYICIRAADLKTGTIDIVFHALVPDDDWDDGIRNEVDKKVLAQIIKV